MTRTTEYGWSGTDVFRPPIRTAALCHGCSVAHGFAVLNRLVLRTTDQFLRTVTNLTLIHYILQLRLQFG